MKPHCFKRVHVQSSLDLVDKNLVDIMECVVTPRPFLSGPSSVSSEFNRNNKQVNAAVVGQRRHAASGCDRRHVRGRPRAGSVASAVLGQGPWPPICQDSLQLQLSHVQLHPAAMNRNEFAGFNHTCNVLIAFALQDTLVSEIRILPGGSALNVACHMHNAAPLLQPLLRVEQPRKRDALL